MTYRLLLTAGKSAHKPFEFDTLVAACAAAEEAFDLGYLRRDEPDIMKKGEDNVLIYQLGPGSSMHVASEARLDELQREVEAEGVRMQKMAQGLVVPAAEKKNAYPYVLIVQTILGQMAPMGYSKRADAVKAVEEGIVKGRLHHEEADDDHFYLQMGPGTLYMILSAEHYEMQKRKAMESAILQAQQNHALQQAEQAQQRPGIILPGGKN